MKIKYLDKIAMTIALLSCSMNGFSDAPAHTQNFEMLNNSVYLRLKADIQNRLINTWCSAEKAGLIMDLIVSKSLNTCVEIGAFTGSSFLPIVSSIQYLGRGHAYAIDAWSNEKAVQYMDDEDPNKSWWVQVDMKKAHFFFQKMLRSRGLQSYCTEFHCSSETIVGYFGEIDFLHMDGNYTTEGSLKDAFLYYPKVKMGGYILVSNAHICINHDLPKLDLLYYLEERCETITVVDAGNSVLYRKIKE